MKKSIFLIVISVSLISIAPLFSATVQVGTYPVFQGVNAADTQVAVDDMVTDANDNKLIKQLGDQKNLAGGFASATAFSSSSTRIYTAPNQGAFFVSLGTGANMLGFDAISAVSNLDDKPDPEAGLTGVSVFTVGMNGDKINGMPVKGLIFHATFGYLPLSPMEDLTINSMLAGAGIDYKVYTPTGGSDSFKPSSVLIGTGVYYSSNTLTYKHEKDFTSDRNGVYYNLNQKSDIKIQSSVITIPVDVTTSAKAAYFLNIFAGTGCDVVLGSTEISVDSKSDISAYSDSNHTSSITKTQQEEVAVTGTKTKASPAIVIPRITAGIGFAMGQFNLDFPVTYYPTNGIAAGITATVIF